MLKYSITYPKRENCMFNPMVVEDAINFYATQLNLNKIKGLVVHIKIKGAATVKGKDFSGYCQPMPKNRHYKIFLANDLSLLENLAHELTHVRQFALNHIELLDDGRYKFKGSSRLYRECQDTNNYKYFLSPEEIEAYGYGYALSQAFIIKNGL